MVWLSTPMPLALFSSRRGFLPPLSPQPPFHPGGVERGSEQPHLSLSRRLGFYWLSTCGHACRTGERRRRRDGFRGLDAGVFAEIRGLALSLPTSALSQRAGACGALAGATKSNVAVGSPLSPAGRERGWGREWENPTPLSPQPPFHPGGVERGSEQPHLSLSRRLGFYWLSTCGYACRTGERRRRRDGFRGLGAGVFAEIRGLAPSLATCAFSQRAGACGALAGATKPNVAVGSPLPPGGAGEGLGERVGRTFAKRMKVFLTEAHCIAPHVGSTQKVAP